MIFNSIPFILLVFVTLILYYNKSLQKYQIYILIISSFVFYAYGQPYLLFLLFISASINAIVSYIVYFESKKKKKKQYAILGLVFNIGVLSFFKYSPMFGKIVEDFNSIHGVGEFLVSVPLPIGISFYTFQGISLVMDLYRSNHQSECPLFKVDRSFNKHYFDTIFFISFFPQLVAGPIVKAYQFYLQIKTKYFKEKGVKIFFYEMPISNKLLDSKKYFIIKNTLENNFDNIWLKFNNNDYQITDGIHLAYKNAFKFSKNFLKELDFINKTRELDSK